MNNSKNGHNNNTQYVPKGQSYSDKAQSGRFEGSPGGQRRKDGNSKRGGLGGSRGGRGSGRGGKDSRGSKPREDNMIVRQLMDATKEAYDKSYIEQILKEQGNSFDKAINFLNAQKANSWSNKVKKAEPYSSPNLNSPALPSKNPEPKSQPIVVQQSTAPQGLSSGSNGSDKNSEVIPQQKISEVTPQQKNSEPKEHQQSPPNKPKNPKKTTPAKQDVKPVEKAPEPPKETHHEEEYNADAKIEALKRQFDNELKGIEEKRLILTALKEEVATFTADCDKQIENLTNEKEVLCSRRKDLEFELLQIQGRVEQIDGSVSHLKQEKVQKIRGLEEKSRTVLEDKS